ncbi:putative ATPase [Leptopilina boulardi filamentous virus]|uniref:Putative ATPase n=1 Tax=Leptopilina boulardi filamentous virus TaxID=552509 RepID=A0A1S5YD15_9VIRU|nr:putative ATPase [Leptopilina boulardi filamentous virus]AQQ80001.1 putative ATPase [Leptopilina boulardi filamentous virus]
MDKYIAFSNPQLMDKEDEKTEKKDDTTFFERIKNLEIFIANINKQHKRLLQNKSNNSVTPEQYERYFNDAILESISCGEEIDKLLIAQDGKLSKKQYLEYSKWYDIVTQLGVYRYLKEDNALSNIEKYVSDLLLNDTNTIKTLDDLLYNYQKQSEETNSSNLNELLFKPNVSFNEFSGRIETIKYIKNILDVSPLFDNYVSMILGGPPGVGKSQIAIASMTYFQSEENYILNMPELSSGVVGSAEKVLKKLFNRVYTNPNIKFSIFLDEADEIFKLDVPAHLKSVAMTIQTSLQGTYKFSNNLLFIIATNYQNYISQPIKDRIGAMIFIDVPDKQEIFQMFFSLMGIFDNNMAALQNLNTAYLNNVLEPFLKKIPKVLTYRNIKNIYTTAVSEMVGSEINKQRAQNKTTTDFYFLIYNNNNNNVSNNSSLVAIQVDEIFYNSLNEEFKISFVNQPNTNISANIDIIYKTVHLTLEQIKTFKNFYQIDKEYYRPELSHLNNASKTIHYMNKDSYEMFLKNNGNKKSIYNDRDFQNNA